MDLEVLLIFILTTGIRAYAPAFSSSSPETERAATVSHERLKVCTIGLPHFVINQSKSLRKPKPSIGGNWNKTLYIGNQTHLASWMFPSHLLILKLKFALRQWRG